MVRILLAGNPLEVFCAVVKLVPVDVIDKGFLVWVWNKCLSDQTANTELFNIAVRV